MKIVASANLGANESIKTLGPFQDYPAPVEFLSGSEFRYSLHIVRDWPDSEPVRSQDEREEVISRQAPWTEK